MKQADVPIKIWNVPGTFHILIGKFSYFVIRFLNQIFALGADEFVIMLEGKIREAPFFKVQSGKITV